jgi:hypothetical protein
MTIEVKIKLPEIICDDKLSTGGIFIVGLGHINLEQAFNLSDDIKKAAEKVLEVRNKTLKVLGIEQ